MERVLQVFPRFRLGGIPVVVMNFYRAIDKTRIQFDFITFSKEKGAFYDEIISLGGRVFYIPKFNGHNLFKVRKAWNTFFNEHPEYKIMHSHVRSTACLYLPIAKKHGVITIEHSHSTSNGKGISSFVKYLFQLPLRKQADYLFACSDIAGKWLFGKNATKRNNYKMLPNGIDSKLFRYSKTNRDIVRSEFGIPADSVVLGHSGRFHCAKNHLFVLDIFDAYHKINPNSYLLLVGDGDLRTQIEKRIIDLHLDRYVKITGMIKEVAPYYSAMDIFIFPSLWEGLPVSVVESQAAGLPTLISDTITSQVNISPLVRVISIDNGTNPWIDSILSSKLEKLDAIDSIKRNGFDIEDTAEWLASFYIGVANGKIHNKIR